MKKYKKPRYNYQVIDCEVTDGDTVKATIDLGFSIYMARSFRLLGINCPEKGTKDGDLATEYLCELLTNWQFSDDSLMTIVSYKHGKYRWLGELFIDGKSINQQMVDAGHAVLM